MVFNDYVSNLSRKVKAVLHIIILLMPTKLTGTKDQLYCWDFWGTKLNRGTSCGHSAQTSRVSYVMSGRDADLGEFPWMARLYYRSKNMYDQTLYAECAASVIHESYIITVAHCCDERLVLARLGDYDDMTKEDCSNGRCAPPAVDKMLESFVRHEDFNQKTLKNDICLIRTKKPIIFTEFIHPVCLPLYCDLQTSNYDNVRFTIAGWGYKDNVNFISANILQKIDLPNVPVPTCQLFWRNYSVSSAQVCAGMEFGRDVCKGDSGGPLMLRAEFEGPSRYFLVGLVSFGPKCSPKSYNPPGAYTRVSYYLPWILRNMK